MHYMCQSLDGACVSGRGMLGDGLSHVAIFLNCDLENRKVSCQKGVKGGIMLEDLVLLKKPTFPTTNCRVLVAGTLLLLITAN